MIALRMLHYIDRRCRQAFPDRCDEPFGGLNIILAGDFFQLPPVLASWMSKVRHPGIRWLMDTDFRRRTQCVSDREHIRGWLTRSGPGCFD